GRRPGRWLDRGAGAVEVVGAADLGRGAVHGLWRRAVAGRPAAAGRRAQTRPQRHSGSGGVAPMRRIAQGLTTAFMALLVALPAFALDLGTPLKDPAAEARARALFG